MTPTPGGYAPALCASADRALHELGRLRVGEGPIPTLASLFALVGGRVPLLLEVKVDGDIWRWVPALRRALKGYDGPFGVMSFDARLPRLLKTNLPEVRRGLVVRDSLHAAKRWLAMWLASPDFLAVDVAALGKPWVDAGQGAHAGLQLDRPHARAARRQPAVHADAPIWEADGRP